MAEHAHSQFDDDAIHAYFSQVRPWEKTEREEHFRNYDTAPAHVKEFYQQNHGHQTYQFVVDTEARYSARESRTLAMSMMDMLVISGELRDASDPDNDHPQIVHALQSALSVRMEGGPEWLEVTALVHDVGKLLGTPILSEDPNNPREPLPQWAVVGDTFPVGVEFSEKIVFPKFFDEDPEGKWEGNPDRKNPDFNTPTGIYEEHTGLDNLKISFSHDGYLRAVLEGEARLPKAAMDMIGYHSLYPVHREGAYQQLLSADDRKAISAAIGFNKHDLYSKNHHVPDEQETIDLLNHYKPILEDYFPHLLHW
jgi:inositol oxygenase